MYIIYRGEKSMTQLVQTFVTIMTQIDKCADDVEDLKMWQKCELWQMCVVVEAF